MPKSGSDDMLSANMVRLEELEARFNSDPFSDLPMTEWDFIGGVVRAWTLLSRRGIVSVVKVFLPSGALFPLHSHDETEVLVLYEGKAQHKSVLPEEKIMTPGDCVQLLPGVTHQMEALEDTWLVAVTVPDSEAFAK